MKDERKTKKERAAELTETVRSNNRIWLLASGMVILLSTMVWLDEILDFPHLLLGAPVTPLNWREATIETAVIAAVVLFVVYGLIRDIGERKRAAEALRESEQRLSATLMSIGDAMIATDARGLVTLMNPVAENLTGWNEAEAVGQPLENIFNIINEQTGERAENPVVRVLREGVVVGLANHTVLIAKDGTKRPIADSGSPMRDEKGNIIGTVMVFRDATERRRAEEALRQSEERYRTVVEYQTDLICRFLPDGTLTFVNQAYCRYHGQQRQELIGHSFMSHVPPEERERVAQHLASFSPEKPVATIEHQAVAAGGKVRWQQWINRPIFDEQGNVTEFQAVGRDVTERVQAEEALKRRMEQLAALGQTSRAVTASLELDQVLAQIVSLTGEVVAADYTSVVLVDEAGHLSESTENMPDVPSVEYRIRDEGLTSWIMRSRQGVIVDEIGEDGAMTPALGEGAPHFANSFIVEAGVRSVAGLPLESSDRLLGVLYLHSLRPAAFQGQLPLLITFANQAAIAIENARLYEAARRELAERKRTEKALVESEERYRTLFEDSPIGLYRTTPEGKILTINPALMKMLGYPDRESLLAINVKDAYMDSDDRAQWRALVEREEIMRKSEIQWRRYDGTVIWVRESSRVVRDDDGRVLYYEGAAEDITERKQAEQQLRQQEQLAAVGQLAGGIAHDFNNMLTTIMLYAHMGLGKSEHDLPQNVTRAFETILDESRQAAKLVQQILDFSRRSPIEIGPMDLGPFVQKTLHVLERTIPENINLQFDAGPEEYVVNGDPTRIQQVLMNLVVNARDAMPHGGDLRIALSRVEVSPGDEPPVIEMAPGEWVCLAVSDTGTGISPEALAHIFEPFFTTKEPGQGTGLGLAQVYGIVAQHGGHVGVETEVGQGTTFRVYLPASGAEEEVVEEGALSSIPQGQGEIILLVEDNENLREGGRDLLESLGYRVLTAANGREALEVCRTVKGIALVITDIVMPEMGGKRLMQELGRTIPALKVLALTGYAMEESREELKEAGFLDVVYKPFEVDTLAQVVRWALDED